MSGPAAKPADDLRDRILAQPEVVLEDHELMRALIAANEKTLGRNVLDLRGVAMERLEARLDRLEDTHRSVIAAAYENLAGTNQVHRAVLRMLEPTDFESFLTDFGGEVADILRVDAARLVLETGAEGADPALDRLSEVLSIVRPGYVSDYLSRGRNVPLRQVTLRQLGEDEGGLYGEGGAWIRSEACLRLDLGPGTMPAMLALGAEDPHHFSPTQGTDLLAFFAGAVERAIRRWLA